MSLYSGDEIPRYQDENIEKLTKLEVVERERAIGEMMRQFPDASPSHVQMCWNYIHRNGLEKVRDQIETGFFNAPSQFAHPVQN